MIASQTNGIAFVCGRPRHRPKDPTVIFLHGSGLAAAFWHRQVDELADQMNTVAIDLPGHGRSDKPALKSVRAPTRQPCCSLLRHAAIRQSSPAD